MKNLKLSESIAKDFLCDSSDFLKRFGVLFESSITSHIGLRSKLLIDLIFSAECSLKALIFLNSNKNEKEIYNQIFTHKLQDLLDKLPSDEKNQCSSYIDEKLLDYDIGNRYLIETHKTYRSNGFLSEKYYNTISNFNWLKNVYNNFSELNKYVWTKIKVPIEDITFNEINIDNLKEEHSRIMNLKKNRRRGHSS
ncbi:MAG: hypothetical protein PF638_16120 [Candidatus Delongbacteria bacterium]|jgi:hypothetical protein|nr:hypothetical protein [Candidatus Delongbacteria bacterium]